MMRAATHLKYWEFSSLAQLQNLVPKRHEFPAISRQIIHDALCRAAVTTSLYGSNGGPSFTLSEHGWTTRACSNESWALSWRLMLMFHFSWQTQSTRFYHAEEDQKHCQSKDSLLQDHLRYVAEVFESQLRGRLARLRAAECV